MKNSRALVETKLQAPQRGTDLMSVVISAFYGCLWRMNHWDVCELQALMGTL